MKTFEEKSQSEEWGAWKFVSDMLDTPNPNPELAKSGIYHTSKCYEQIHDFVVEQKKKAHQAGIDEERKRIKKLLNMREASPRSDFDSDEEYQLHRQKIGAINWYSRLIKGQIDLPDLPETNY